MRTLATFLITVGVTAPALLDANIEVDGKKLRPHQKTFEVDGTRVTLDVDRALVTTGDKVTATLVAYSDTPKQIALDLRLVQSHIQLGERVSPPEHQIDREKITLQATPDGGKARVALVLGTPRKSLGQLDQFTIFVAPHGTPSPTKHDFDGDADSGADFWQASIDAGKAASVDVTGWSGNSISMRTVAEGPIVVGQPFVVAVHVKNTTGKTLPSLPQVDLATADELAGTAGDDPAVTIDEIDAHEAATATTLPRGGEVVRRFKVTPTLPLKDVTLAISATALGDDIGPIAGGARDAITFHATESAAKIALK
ncbi:MAG TPA: hypothetical protein VGL61_15995 [Kofleriaceae bacterium]|jgi:hypothetical protein